jgi:tRNA threonylcarbamoyladenosine biosynthesis protein TsaE
MDIIFTLNEIEDAAKAFLANTAPYKVIAVHGEMGAGKTTFVHTVCNVLGVKDTIGSPTFSAEIIYHIDLYRLKDEEEAIQAGVEDCLYSGNYCFVEWPGRAPAIFPDNTLHISIVAMNNDTRKLIINL